MNKEIRFSADARNLMAKGIETLNNATKVTLGPKGRNVIIEQDFGSPLIVNDGVTIAKAIKLKNKFENLGASILIEAATKTNDIVGDGTTSAILLSSNLILSGIEAVNKGHNPVLLRNGFNYYLGHILEMIEQVSTPVESEEDILKIATLSSGNPEIGAIITKAYSEVGKDGIITIEESQGLETYLDVVKGYSYDRGYLSPYMATDQEKMISLLDKPLILVTDKKINTMQEIMPFLEQSMKSTRPLLIICDDMSSEVLGAILVNKLRGVFNVVVTKAPSFGERKIRLLEDIAVITGATFINESMGNELNNQPLNILGTAGSVKVSREQTVIVNGSGNDQDILNRLSSIKLEIQNTTNQYDKDKLQERIAKILGGVAVIKVGAPTEIELNEKKLRLEDALNATRCAMTSGIIEGGGKVLYEISEQITTVKRYPEFNVALDILNKVLKEPFRQIIRNSGEEVDKIEKRVNHNLWYDASTSNIVNLKPAGIIDPTSVTKSVITTAVSIASVFLTTECAIVNTEQAKLNEEELV